uniref:Putative adenylate cyclase terminal-differentiation specific n=1 Tax=Anopheles marajoara TaxID=58244 RepID=A0A2M4B8T8_9DIPT
MSCQETTRAQQDDPYAFTESAPLQANSLVYANHSSAVGTNAVTVVSSSPGGIKTVPATIAATGGSVLATGAGPVATLSAKDAITISGTRVLGPQSFTISRGTTSQAQVIPQQLKVRYNGVVSSTASGQKTLTVTAATPVFTKPLQIKQQTTPGMSPVQPSTVTVGKLIKKVVPQKSPLLATVVAGSPKGITQVHQQPQQQQQQQPQTILQATQLTSSNSPVISAGSSILTTVTTPTGTALKLIKIPANQLSKATVTGLQSGNFIQVGTAEGARKLLASGVNVVSAKPTVTIAGSGSTPVTIAGTNSVNRPNTATIVSGLPTGAPTKIRLIQPQSQGKFFLHTPNGTTSLATSTTQISNPISIATIRNSIVRQQQINVAKPQQLLQQQQPKGHLVQVQQQQLIKQSPSPTPSSQPSTAATPIQQQVVQQKPIIATVSKQTPQQIIVQPLLKQGSAKQQKPTIQILHQKIIPAPVKLATSQESLLTKSVETGVYVTQKQGLNIQLQPQMQQQQQQQQQKQQQQPTPQQQQQKQQTFIAKPVQASILQNNPPQTLLQQQPQQQQAQQFLLNAKIQSPSIKIQGQVQSQHALPQQQQSLGSPQLQAKQPQSSPQMQVKQRKGIQVATQSTLLLQQQQPQQQPKQVVQKSVPVSLLTNSTSQASTGSLLIKTVGTGVGNRNGKQVVNSSGGQLVMPVRSVGQTSLLIKPESVVVPVKLPAPSTATTQLGTTTVASASPTPGPLLAAAETKATVLGAAKTTTSSSSFSPVHPKEKSGVLSETKSLITAGAKPGTPVMVKAMPSPQPVQPNTTGKGAGRATTTAVKKCGGTGQKNNPSAPVGKQPKGKRTYTQRATQQIGNSEKLPNDSLEKIAVPSPAGLEPPVSTGGKLPMFGVTKVKTEEGVTVGAADDDELDVKPPKLKYGSGHRGVGGGAIAVPISRPQLREWHAPGSYMFDLKDPDDDSEDEDEYFDESRNTLSFWYEESIAVVVPEATTSWSLNPPQLPRAGPSGYGGSGRGNKEKKVEPKFEIRQLTRDEQLELKKAYLQRRALQCRNGLRVRNVTAAKRRLKALGALVKKLEIQREQSLNEEREKPKCLSDGCNEAALVMTTHCYNHITENTNQRLFQRCTAKFSDNSQCRAPVFDVTQELILCKEHAWKHDNHDKMSQEVKQKQKPLSTASVTAMVTATAAAARKKPKPLPPPVVVRPQKRAKVKKKKLTPLQQQMLLHQQQYKQFLGNNQHQHHHVQSIQANQQQQLQQQPPQQRKPIQKQQQQSLLINGQVLKQQQQPGVNLNYVNELRVQQHQQPKPQQSLLQPTQSITSFHQQQNHQYVVNSTSSIDPIDHIPLGTSENHTIGDPNVIETSIFDDQHHQHQSHSTIHMVDQIHQQQQQQQHQEQQILQSQHDFQQFGQQHQVTEDQLLLDYMQQQQELQQQELQQQMQQQQQQQQLQYVHDGSVDVGGAGGVHHQHHHHHNQVVMQQPMLQTPLSQDLLSVCENSSAYASSEDTGVGGLSESEILGAQDVNEEIIPFMLNNLPDALNDLIFTDGTDQTEHVGSHVPFENNGAEAEDVLFTRVLDDMTMNGESANFLGEFLNNCSDEILNGADICSEQILHSPNTGNDIRGLVHTLNAPSEYSA